MNLRVVPFFKVATQKKAGFAEPENFLGFETDPNFLKSKIWEENKRPNVEQIL